MSLVRSLQGNPSQGQEQTATPGSLQWVASSLCLPIGISQRMTSNTSVLQDIKRNYRGRRVMWLPEFSKCLTRLNVKVFFETGLLEAFGVHYEYKRRGKEYIVCSALMWPQNPSFWKGSQRVMWLGNILWGTLNSGIHGWHQHIFTHYLLWTQDWVLTNEH